MLIRHLFQSIRIVMLILVAGLFCTISAHAGQERILSYDVLIQVQPSAKLIVKETIRVYATGEEIKRGIYRDFPTKYKDARGNNYRTTFKVLEVLRDGINENFFLKPENNGMRVYIGEKDRFLQPGEYTYTIMFETDRQLGFFKDFDELYFNAIGTGWTFPIEKATVTVELPRGAAATIQEMGGYSGRQGGKQKDFTISRLMDGSVFYETTRMFFAGEGLTIVVSWDKGFVHEPTQTENWINLLNDNKGSLLGLLGLAGIFGYYFFIWSRVGKDPEKGTIIPLFEPPSGFSPAATRYLTRMGYDEKAFGAAVINMAVKGYLRISEEKGVYTLTPQDTKTLLLSPDEKAIADNLFAGKTPVELKNVNHRRISKSIDQLKKTLHQSCEKNYFVTNVRYFGIGSLISMGIIVVSIILESRERLPMAFMVGLWLAVWSVGVAALLQQVITLWRGYFSSNGKNFIMAGGALFMSLFALPFVVGELFGLGMLAYSTSILLMIIVTAIGIVNVLFFNLLKAPTLLGRKVLDQIEGFKMYLSVAEKDHLNALAPREKTPAHFEKYLPYALALGVEQAWAQKFNDVLKNISGEEYRPSWYSGHGFHYTNPGMFASALGSSVSSAIASSSTAPGSSSGGGGGGSSGGGGGGGGGGGW